MAALSAAANNVREAAVVTTIRRSIYFTRRLPAARLALAFFALAGPYFLRALASQLARLCRLLILRHAFSAFASLAALICAAVGFAGGGGGAGTMLPIPEKVALAGKPKISGCGVGAGLQEASVVHGGGGDGGAVRHGEALVHSWAS